MTWPADATRAEVIRLLEANRHFATWVISREETEMLLALLRGEWIDAHWYSGGVRHEGVIRKVEPNPDDGYLHTTLHGVKVKVLLDKGEK
jgi:hypothetical protein